MVAERVPVRGSVGGADAAEEAAAAEREAEALEGVVARLQVKSTGGTSFVVAMQAARRVLETRGGTGHPTAVLMLTDGGCHDRAAYGKELDAMRATANGALETLVTGWGVWLDADAARMGTSAPMHPLLVTQLDEALLRSAQAAVLELVVGALSERPTLRVAARAAGDLEVLSVRGVGTGALPQVTLPSLHVPGDGVEVVGVARGGRYELLLGHAMAPDGGAPPRGDARRGAGARGDRRRRRRRRGL